MTNILDMLLGASWRTSLFGIAGAFFLYFTQVGVAFPTTGKEWFAAIGSALIYAWSRVQRDNAVSSEDAGAK